MKNKVLKTLIATSIVASTIGGNIAMAVPTDGDNSKKDQNEDGKMLRGHGDNFPVKHSIMGGPSVSKEAFKSYLNSQKNKYGFDYKLTVSMNEWVDTVYEESAVEGVRADIVIAQAIKETGWFRFGGELSYKDNNFAGIGVTGDSGAKNSFATAREGIRAQVQHLKAYASTEALVNPCVDPRFNLVTRGSAPSVEELAGRWAYPGYNTSQYSSLKEAAQVNATYGQQVYKLVDEARSFDNGQVVPEVDEDIETGKPEAPTMIAKGKVINVSSRLNIRSGAGTGHSVVGSLKAGQNINIYESKNGWHKVDYSVNGSTKFGYVSGKYIKVTENTEVSKPDTEKPEVPVKPEIPVPPTDGVRNGTVIGISSRLNVRSGAGTNYSVLTTITNNTTVKINSEKNGWYNVTLSNGKTGYVSSKYIKVINNSGNSDANTDNTEVLKRGKVSGISTVLNVRNDASMQGKVVTYLRNNETVEIVGESGGWYKIKSSKSDSAFVSKKYITVS